MEELWLLSPQERREFLRARRACLKLKNLAKSRNIYALMLYRRALRRYGEIIKRVRILKD
jgi:hypothetical protein